MRDAKEEDLVEAMVVVVIRQYDPLKDRAGAEAVDGGCEVGPAGGMSLHADLLGDPEARIRHSPDYLMLVRLYSGAAMRHDSTAVARSCRARSIPSVLLVVRCLFSRAWLG